MLVIVFYELDQSVFLYRGAGVVVDARVEKGSHLHLRGALLEGSVVSIASGMELVAKIAWNLLPWESTGKRRRMSSTTFP